MLQGILRPFQRKLLNLLVLKVRHLITNIQYLNRHAEIHAWYIIEKSLYFQIILVNIFLKCIALIRFTFVL